MASKEGSWLLVLCGCSVVALAANTSLAQLLADRTVRAFSACFALPGNFAIALRDHFANGLRGWQIETKSSRLQFYKVKLTSGRRQVFSDPLARHSASLAASSHDQHSTLASYNFFVMGCCCPRHGLRKTETTLSLCYSLTFDEFEYHCTPLSDNNHLQRKCSPLSRSILRNMARD